MGDVPSFLHGYGRPAAGRDRFITMVSAQGAVVIDDQGRRYIDALASLWYCNVGHGRPEIIEAITRQLGELEAFQTFDRFTNPAAEALTDELVRLAPMPDARVFLTCSGSEAVDSAIKFARLAHTLSGTSRSLVISREPSYHGVTYGAMTVTGLAPNRSGFGPDLPDVVRVPHDDLTAVDRIIAERGDDVAAIIAEPVIGAGGLIPPTDGYLQGLRRRCDDISAFLILDEVICGFGRLGAWWGSQHYEVVPDLVTFAKAVTSGYQPLGGVLIGRAVRGPLESDPSYVLRHGHTYSGHPACCAAGVANLQVINDERLWERAGPIGERLHTGLSSLVGKRVVELRGAGAMCAIDLEPGLDATDLRDALLTRGVIARPLGTSTVAFCPPLVIDDAAIDDVVEATALAVDDIA